MRSTARGSAKRRWCINPAREFLEVFYKEAAEETGGLDLYTDYEKWCGKSGYKTLGSRMFGKEVKRVFPKSESRKSGTINPETKKRHTVYTRIEEQETWAHV